MAEELIHEFAAKDDQGRTYTIRHYRQWKDVSADDDPGGIRPGRDRYQTADGRSVNPLGKGVYQIVPSGVNVPNGVIVRCDAL
jgi:hypothetical protein